MQDVDWHLFQRLQDRLKEAEKKHPLYAEGPWQGLSRITEEHGELAQALNHGAPQDVWTEEAWDLLVVVWRFVREDWKQ